MAKRAALAAILGAVVALSGCTGADLVTDLGRATAEKACGNDCLGSQQVQQGIAIPRDFVPVAATRCTFVFETIPDGRQQRVRVEQRADGDLTALVTALQEKTGYPAKGECTMIERLAVVVTLVNEAGLHVTPTAPTHGCGDAFASVLMAVAQLSWTEVSRTPLAESQVGPATRCPNVSQPVVATAAATGPPLFPDGTYMTAVTCDRPPPNAVVIYPADGASGAPVTVEVGGCFRMLDVAGNRWQLDAGTVALLNITDPTIK